MNIENQKFYVTVDQKEPNVFIDQRLAGLFPDNRLGVVMPREKWPSYGCSDLSKAEVTLIEAESKIIVTAFNLAGNVRDERTIGLRDEPDNMRFQIQYVLGQLGAHPLSNGRVSGTTPASLNL
ncbi:MAG: hypothetical protein HRT94_04795 [Alphaproteobacteria bacterium]|nr:hypothetical protein [Alphaproteobacteria bacterium]